MSQLYPDNIPPDTQLAWTNLLLASFALGALIIWSVSNQQLLLTNSHYTPNRESQIAPLPTLPDSMSIKSPTLAPTSALTSALKDQALLADKTTIISRDEPRSPQSSSMILALIESAQAQYAQASNAGASNAEANVAKNPVADAKELAIDVALQEPSEFGDPQLTPNTGPKVALKAAPKVTPKAAPVRASISEPVAVVRPVAVKPRETAFDKLRREELAMLDSISAELQIDSQALVLDSETSSSLYRVFELLFLYSETDVRVSVSSNDTSSALRNSTLAQQRADQIVDYLVLSGLNRERFTIVAESTPRLPSGSHRVAIQATLSR